MKKFMFGLALLGIGIMSSSCFGSFNLTKKVYDWNSSVGGKFINNLVFWGLCIIPVYEIAGVVDVLVLNTIEFWTGSNPVAMNEGEIEVQYAEVEGHQFKMTAQKNLFLVEELTENGYELRNEFVYTPSANEVTIVNEESSKTYSTIN